MHNNRHKIVKIHNVHLLKVIVKLNHNSLCCSINKTKGEMNILLILPTRKFL